MLAVTTNENIHIADPSALRRPPPSLPPCPDRIPPGSVCSTWSPDGTSLYLAFASFINRYDAFGYLMKTVYSLDDNDSTITSLIVKDKGSIIFATESLVHILEHSSSQTSSSKIVQTLSPHPDSSAVTSLSLSSDGTLLVAASATTIVTHNLSLGSHTTLRGLKTTEDDPISTCTLHPHSRIRLFVGIGSEFIIYDVTRPNGPAKIIPLVEAGGGRIVAITCSPYSKTLIAVACDNGYVGLIDLDKEHGKVIRNFHHGAPLTSISFSLDGATLFVGTETGKLLVQSLRAAGEPAKTVVINESGFAVLHLTVSKKKPSKDSKPTTPASVPVSASAPSLGGHLLKPLAQKDTNSPPRDRRHTAAIAVKSPLASGPSATSSPVVPRPRTRLTSTARATSPTPEPKTRGAVGLTPMRKRVNSTSDAMKSKEPLPGDVSADIESIQPVAHRTRPKSRQRTISVPKSVGTPNSPPPLPLPSALAAASKLRSTGLRNSAATRATKSSSSTIVAANTDDATAPVSDKVPPIRIRTKSTSARSTTSVPAPTLASPTSKRTRTISSSSQKSPSSLTSGVRSRTVSTTSTARTSIASGSSKPPASATLTVTQDSGLDATTTAKTRTTSGSSSGSGTTTSTNGTRSRKGSAVSRSGTGSGAGVTVARLTSPIPPVPPLPAFPKIEKGAKSGDASTRARQAAGGSGGDSTKTREAVEVRTPSPDLPMPSPVKESMGLADQQTELGMLRLGTPEVERWIRAGHDEGDGEDDAGRRKVEFVMNDDDDLIRGFDVSRLEDVDIDDEEDIDIQRRLVEHEQKLEEKSITMQVTPRRLGNGAGMGAGSLPSPFMRLAAASPHEVGLSAGAASGPGGAQGLLHALIQDAMVDFRQETKAEMVGLHLDLLRMGRVWRTEMKNAMDEYGNDLRELREENKRLREENEKLRRGY